MEWETGVPGLLQLGEEGLSEKLSILLMTILCVTLMGSHYNMSRSKAARGCLCLAPKTTKELLHLLNVKFRLAYGGEMAALILDGEVYHIGNAFNPVSRLWTLSDT